MEVYIFYSFIAGMIFQWFCFQYDSHKERKKEIEENKKRAML